MYDAGTRPDRYLRAYAREFATVEVDSTFYGTPAPERLLRWAQTVPPAFTFALKLPREITHERRLIGCEALSAEFFANAAVLGPQLEAVLVQFDATFGPEEEGPLARFVEALPAGVRVAIELRHPAWFSDPVYSRLTALLRAGGVALAATDGTFVPLDVMLDALERPTAPFAYLRWLGRRDAVVRFDRVTIDRSAQIERWVQAIRRAASALERISGYANNHYMGHSPATIRALYAALGVRHERPAHVVQESLF